MTSSSNWAYGKCPFCDMPNEECDCDEDSDDSYTFKSEIARRSMILISKHFIKNKSLSINKFWEILAKVSKSFKEDKDGS